MSRAEKTPVGCDCWELGQVIYDRAHRGGGLGNERMIRTASRVGHRECGRVPEARPCEDQRQDSLCLALLRRDWEEGWRSGLEA